MQHQNSINYTAHKDFRKVFIKKERKELFGKRYKNLFWLVVILIITFLSLGFANGSLKYLKMKMDDPFIKWVNIDVPYTMQDQIHEIKEMLLEKSNKSKFDYHSVAGNYEFSMQFAFFNSDKSTYFKGRSIEADNPIINSIFSDKNKIIGKSLLKKQDIGLIITDKLLEQLGYKTMPHYISLNSKINNVMYKVPLPVVAVVKNLPNKNNFATTSFLFIKVYHSLSNPFDLSKKEYHSELIYYIPGDKATVIKIEEDIINFVKGKYGKEAFINVIKIPDKYTYQDGYRLHLVLDKKIFNNDFTSVDKEISKAINEQSKKIYRVYNYNLSGFDQFNRSFDQLSVNFRSLDKIRDFHQFVFDKYKLKINMSLIESKENYNFVTKLTKIILLFLIVLSVISVILYVTNILILHLEKIKKNIGTFKAFGLTNKIMKYIYARMINEFILLALIISFGISIILGKIGFIRLLLIIFGTKLEKSQSYFNLINNQYALYSVILIFLFSIIAIITRLNMLLNKTPGDLIYDRD